MTYIWGWRPRLGNPGSITVLGRKILVCSAGSKGGGTQNVLNFMRFLENFWQNHRQAPLPTGNPGAAPGLVTKFFLLLTEPGFGFSKQIRQSVLLICLWSFSVGLGNDGFLCNAMYCTHYTGQGVIVFYCAHPGPCPGPGPVQCV